MTIHVDAAKIWHDCSLEEPRPRIYPWYNYEACRDNNGEWEFHDRQVIFCPVCGLNLEETYQLTQGTICAWPRKAVRHLEGEQP